MNLPNLYASICKGSPELAVTNLTTSTNVWADDHPPITVWLYGWKPKTSEPIVDEFAYALIFDLWTRKLPPYHVLARFGSGWLVYKMGDEPDHKGFTVKKRHRLSGTAIEALAEFYFKASLDRLSRESKP